ncbi:MAG TPA: hypothetical protein VM911_09040 [Pyrinomonadaceae bacterium]|jgi:hypothetical protein|nr:hypothetical protein [Pyrinomonadaceae bacterium]
MKTVTCSACNAENINPTASSVCASCGESLAPALFQQSVDELKKLTDKLQQPQKPARSFYSFNGFGTTLLDYRALSDGTYQATRWVIALFLPIFPLATYVIEPLAQEFGYGQETSRFRIVDKTKLSAARVLRTYLLAVIGLLPAVLGFIYSREINRNVKGLYALALMILIFAWGVYFIFFKLKNEGKAYRAPKTSPDDAQVTN